MLPKLAISSFETKLFSLPNKIEFRPFLAKEQKILLMALEGKSNEEMAHAVLKILESCVLTPGIDISKLPPFDIEKLFLEIRKRSIGEVIELNIRHPEQNSTCQHVQKVLLNLDDIDLVVNPKHTRKIKLTDEIGVVMRYPTAKTLERYQGSSVGNVFALMAACIESVYDQDNVYSDFSEKEINDWLETLNDEQLKKIGDFFQTMPELSHKISYTCDSCKQNVEVKLKGLRDFFT